jgi:hypothetical protein
MICKSHGGQGYEIHCDNCPEILEAEDAEDFFDAVNFAKEECWQIKKINGEWVHFCIDCKNGGANQSIR